MREKKTTKIERALARMDMDTVDWMIIIHKRANCVAGPAQWVSLSRVIMVISFYEIVSSANEFKILADPNVRGTNERTNERKKLIR